MILFTLCLTVKIKVMKRSLLFTLVISYLSVTFAIAQNCNVQGVVRYFFNEYIGYKPDTGAEVMFIKYSTKYQIPKIQVWTNYQTMMDNWRRYELARQYFSPKESERRSGFKEEHTDSILKLSRLLMVERDEMIEKGLVRYSTVVDATGKYSISIPMGIYYILFKSSNRQHGTLLESKNRYYMIKVKLSTSTKVLSYDFDI